MKSFSEWCDHYGYDMDTEEAKQDYARYRAQFDCFRSMFAPSSNTGLKSLREGEPHA